MEKLTHTEHDQLRDGFCPDCGSRVLVFGPRGGVSQNVLCGSCRTEFVSSPICCERLAKPCDEQRQREIYGVDEHFYPVASFEMGKMDRQSLDEAVAKSGKKFLVLGQACHPNYGLAMRYLEGYLEVVCRRCGKPVARIAVA